MRLSDILSQGNRDSDNLQKLWDVTEAAGELAPLPAGEYIAHIVGAKSLLRSGTVREIGADAALLVLLVASYEDRLRYEKAPSFWRAELMDRLGIRSPKDLVRIRNKAVAAGLLHHTQGTRTTPGFYWTLVPDWMESKIRPVPKTELVDANRSQNGTDGASNRSRAGTGKGTGKGTLSIPITYNPSNMPESDSGVIAPSKPKRKQSTGDGFDAWYQAYPRRVGRNKAEKAYSKAVEAIAKADRVSASDAATKLLAWTLERLPSLRATEQKFIPHPSTWLNDGRYRDEIAMKNEHRPELHPMEVHR